MLFSGYPGAIDTWTDKLSLGLLLSQLCLLGMWVGFGATRLYVKLSVAAAGTAVIWTGIALTVTPDLEDFVWLGVRFFTHVVLVAVVCFASNRWWMSLLPPALSSSKPTLRFSIRHLLFATCFYAVTLSIGRMFAIKLGQMSAIDGEISFLDNIWLNMAADTFDALAMVAVSIVAFWSAFGNERLLFRLVAGVSVTGANGLLHPLVFEDWRNSPDLVLTFLATGALLFISLMVVRSNGYRITFH
jgi:hypothetical protein